MPFSWNDLLWGLAVPLLTAGGLRLLLVWLFQQFAAAGNRDPAPEATASAENPRAYPLETSLPLVVGAAVGYFVLKLGPWIPDAHYEWLPVGIAIAMLAAVAVGLLGQSVLIRIAVLPLVYAVVTAGIGILLIPTWEDLSPPYAPYLFCWCIGVTAVSVVTQLSPESNRWPFAVVWLGTCLAVAAIVAISESLRFAQIAGLTFAASLGLVATGLSLRRCLLDGVGLTLTIYLAGILLIAQVNSWSAVPLASYWLPMAGPLLAAVVGVLLSQKCSPALRATLVILAAAIPSTIAVILAFVATLSE
ncbi:hypothetical protein C5Y96_08655 [Blastopirellula marina]|uniref:Uncharacterized protein n=1 Tax=Blastopirellula marina TaxID=124 RepID=A0A2S8FU69_9BACT|nr:MULTISPECIES: hypothetical protein [Pirellulaceae]PQO35715.1 hypothetical protein C5Y96_08655 [Blastopirellula marina]RCS53289.1 hypothetical protein DTL36_08665 [Bremerella cremea]